MKALVYTGEREVTFREEPDPARQDGDVLMQVGAVGICGSDMHAFLGHDARRPAPLILGHEASGTVLEGALEGQKVVVNPLVTCGKCPACLSGRTNLCAYREIISMAPRQGAFAERIAIPERNMVEVPDGMDTATAALAEPIATAWHAVVSATNLSHRPLNECRALVFGGGAVGYSAALVLLSHGCRDVFVAETNELRRATVNRSAGCQAYDPMAEGDGPENDSVDVVIDCVGAKPTRRASTDAIKPGGVIVHVGLSDGTDGMDVRKLTLQEVTFMGTYTYTMQDFRATVAAMHEGALGPLDWFEERPLSEGSLAFDDLLNGRTASAKIVLRP